MKKIMSWTAAGLLVMALTIVVYCLTESDIRIPISKVVIVSQREGDSVAIEVPTRGFELALGNFDMRTRVRNRDEKLIKETEWVSFKTGMDYKFVTYSQLPVGDYVARLAIGYQLNPLSYRETEYPLAIIYVRKKDDHSGTTQSIFHSSSSRIGGRN